MRRAVACLVLLGGAACPEHRDVTPIIHVDPRAAGRLDWLAHAREPASSPSARVHVMKAGEALGGPNAVGRPGDLLLENDEVAFVVDQLGSSAGFAESGGNLVDAADARVRKDELGQAFAYFGTFPRQGLYDTLASGTSGDGRAWIEARGRELYEAKLVVTTRYTLHAGDRALLIETQLENTGDAAIELPSVGDVVQWGGAEKVAPGKPPGFKGPSSGPYVGGVGRFVSYALTATDGVIDATSGGSWTDTAQRKNVKIAPGGKAAYARVLIVGERPDTSSLVGELAMAAGSPVGDIEVHLADPKAMPTGWVVALVAAGSEEKLTLAPPFVARVPVGRYALEGVLRKEAAPVEVRADGVARVEAAIDPPASVAIRCIGAEGIATPCKVTFEGTAPTPTPSFGLPHAAGPARNQVTTADGLAQVSLPKGKYRVTASRGPEYATTSADLDLASGARADRTLALARVVDTSGYLACDFHQHTMLSADAPVSTVDRVIANVAEGVEIAVASEHNVIADLEPIVKDLGLGPELVSIPGDELTTDACRRPWGHANVFPLVPDPSKPRGGAPPVRDRQAHEVFDELRRAGDVVVQVNHPRSGSNGYFDLLGFEPRTGVGTQPGYDAAFDALEVWSGRNIDARGKVRDDFFALLRTGHPVTPTATTDTHGIVGQEAGYPRTYVRVADDGHLGAWDPARTADLVRGIKGVRDVVLTNGPMLRVTAGGAPIGGLARGRAVVVKVHVESAPWVVVDTVTVVRAMSPDKPQSKAVVEKASASGALVADVSFDVRVSEDDALVVVASGARPMSPVLGGDDRETVPWAMTGAVWVDADGDGRALGR
jgi:hypothetical protein